MCSDSYEDLAEDLSQMRKQSLCVVLVLFVSIMLLYSIKRCVYFALLPTS